MTLVDNDVELIQLLDFEFEQTCEHTMHTWDGHKHSDDTGLWSVVVFCQCSTIDVLFCGKYVEWIWANPYHAVWCNTCKRRNEAREAYKILDKVR
jgi:hypothetical protein